MSVTMEEMIREIVKEEVVRVASGPKGDKGRDGALTTDEVKNAVREVLDEKEKELMTKFRSMGRGGFVSGGFMDGNN